MDFYLGCNYWASNAGTEMWRDFDKEEIEKDFQALHENGAEVLRVFPNWRDFQPIMAINGYAGKRIAYRMADGSPDGGNLPNAYGLDEEMLRRFEAVCYLAEKYGLQLMVSLITGWMSGRLFVPPALQNKNVITDPEALRWEYRFVKGFVERMRGQKAIVAWDLGNECNCMGEADADQAYVWTQTIASGIRASDTSRPILSGMHSLAVAGEGSWSMRDQGELTDMLTTHPYPGSPTIGAHMDPSGAYRTLMLPTAQTVLYADISGKPAMIQEQGTLNDVYINRRDAAHAARVNMASCWANGGKGYLWWCAHDQKNLNFLPYELSMRELGWLDMERKPKPVARAMAGFSEAMKKLNIGCFEERETDAVCVLTQGQDAWPAAAMSFLLGKQSGLEIKFACHDMPLPKAPVYLLPSLKGWTPLYKRTYLEILRRVREEGAVLYVSWDGGALEEFENVFRLRSLGQYRSRGTEEAVFRFSDKQLKLPFACFNEGLLLENDGAQVLAETEAGRPVWTKADYGKGKVFFLSFGLEAMLWNQPMAFECGCPFADIYRAVRAASQVDRSVICENPMLCLSRCRKDDKRYAVLINPTSSPQALCLKTAEGTQLRLLHGNPASLPAGEFALWEII